MKASDLGSLVDCPVCGGESCPTCGPDGRVAYYGPESPSEGDRNVVIYDLTTAGDTGVLKKMLSVERFNALVGDGQIDVDNPESLPADKLDRFNNQLGQNAPYSVNGNEVTVDGMPDGWPSDPDLNPAEAVAWLRARGSTELADCIETVVSNQ